VKVHGRRGIKTNKSSNKSYLFKSIGCHGIPKRKLTRIKLEGKATKEGGTVFSLDNGEITVGEAENKHLINSLQKFLSSRVRREADHSLTPKADVKKRWR